MNRRVVIGVGVAGFLFLCVVVVLAVGWYLASPLFLDDVVDESFPTVPSASEIEAMSEAERDEIREDVLDAAADMPDVTMAEAMPAGASPVVLASGSFVDADDFHQGSGSATIYELEDGSRVLRLEDFMVTNGPDLHVLLAESATELGDYVDLGALKGNIGSQNYDIPAGVDISSYGAIVIYCVPFHVLFASAALS